MSAQDVPELQQFREGLLQADPFALMGSWCPPCGATSFPAREFCPRCRNEDGIENRPLSTVGRVHSFTIIRQAPVGMDVPYALAYVDLPESCRLLTRCVATDLERIVIGSRVTLQPDQFPGLGGEPTLGFSFRLQEDLV